MDDAEAKSEETILRFHFSESALHLLVSMFPKALHKFATLYRQPKREAVPEENDVLEEDVVDVSCPNLKSWYNALYRKYEQLFHSESSEHDMYYTIIMADLVRHQSKTDSPRICITQQKYIGTFLMVYFGYLKETLARDFGQDSDSTRYILLFEQLARNVTLGQIDDKLMRKALHECDWVPESEENNRKLMVYDIEDNFPISECLQKENIKMIPAKTRFAVITMTRYYVKACYFHALEDILPNDKYYKTIKGADFTHPFDFYGMICDRVWQHVLKSIYEANPLLEYPENVNIMDIEFTLESYKSFKAAFNEYILNKFPFTFASHPDEKHIFPLRLEQASCNIVLTNRLVLYVGVLPIIASFVDITRLSTRPTAFVFFRPTNFENEENSPMPMLKLIETEVEKLLNIRFKWMIWISSRQFASVHSHQCLKTVSGGTAFGYEALKTGVIRAIETDTFALGIQYFDNDNSSFVEVVNKRGGPSRLIQETDACIITKAGSPLDNAKKYTFLSDLVLNFTHLKNVFKIRKYHSSCLELCFIWIMTDLTEPNIYRYHSDK
ncbi:unnamed protein product [Mucor fragilis]